MEMEPWLEATLACKERERLRKNQRAPSQLQASNAYQRELEQRIEALEKELENLKEEQ